MYRYRKIAGIIFIIFSMVLGLAACDSAAEETTEEVQEAEQAEETQEIKKPIWERSGAEVMAGIEQRLSDQDLFDGEFSLLRSSQTDEDGDLYFIQKDSVQSNCCYSFIEDDQGNVEKFSLLCSDYTDQEGILSFLVGTSALLMECDVAGRYETLSQAKSAFSQILDNAEGDIAEEVMDGAKYAVGVKGTLAVIIVSKEEEVSSSDETSETTVESDPPSTSSSISESTQMTTAQRNALKSAKSYLDYTAFSYNGLIDQLEYEEYSHEDAVYAVEHCGADWNEQAAKMAKQYLDYTSFSRNGLIDQLEYEGFTHEQAVYGVEANGY